MGEQSGTNRIDLLWEESQHSQTKVKVGSLLRALSRWATKRNSRKSRVRVQETGRAIERKGILERRLEKQAGEQGTVAGAEIQSHRTGEGRGAQTNIWCEAVPVYPSVWGSNLDPQIPIHKPLARDQRVKNHVQFYKPTVRSSVWDWLLCRTSPA